MEKETYVAQNAHAVPYFTKNSKLQVVVKKSELFDRSDQI